MNAPTPDGWSPCPPGEFERLAARLTFRKRCLVAAQTAAAVLVTAGVAGGGWAVYSAIESEPTNVTCPATLPTEPTPPTVGKTEPTRNRGILRAAPTGSCEVNASYRVGMAQTLVEGGRPEANLDRAEDAVRRAAARGCRLVVLPECLDLGWTDPSARTLAQPIPGRHSDRLARVAWESGLFVAAGLVKHTGDRLYNSAVLISPSGQILLHHRKINELDIALDLYSVGDRMGVAETELGTLGLAICADNFGSSLAVAHVLARMGAQVILSPSAWAVDSDHDNAHQPYGKLWQDSYTELARLYDVTVIGVSNVGPIAGGPWAGRKCIGCSLAVGPGGDVLATGPYGEAALTVLEVSPRAAVARGTDFAAALAARGYVGP